MSKKSPSKRAMFVYMIQHIERLHCNLRDAGELISILIWTHFVKGIRPCSYFYVLSTLFAIIKFGMETVVSLFMN